MISITEGGKESHRKCQHCPGIFSGGYAQRWIRRGGLGVEAQSSQKQALTDQNRRSPALRHLPSTAVEVILGQPVRVSIGRAELNTDGASKPCLITNYSSNEALTTYRSSSAVSFSASNSASSCNSANAARSFLSRRTSSNCSPTVCLGE